MQDQYTIRPYAAGDEAAFLGLWNEVMWADPISETRWRATYLLDPNFSSEECLVAEIPGTGELVGFALGFTDKTGPSEKAWIVGFGVAQAHRRTGIGTELLTTLMNHWRPKGVGKVHVGPYIPSYLTPGVDVAVYADALPFLASLGAEEGARPVSMKASLTNYRVRDEVVPLTERLRGAGIEVRAATGQDILPLLGFMEVHFPHWLPDARRVLGAIVGEGRATSTLHIATDKGEIIGYAQTTMERFGPFGVNPHYRGQGIGAVLLSRALVAMRAQGFHSAWFLWTSDRTAKLYGQHGFEEVRRFAMVDIPL